MKTKASIRRTFLEKVAIVTGAGSGIGRALATQLAIAGAHVYAIDRDAQALNSLVQETRDAGTLTSVSLDVTDSQRYEKAVATIYQNEGSVQFLFNNAGVTLLAEAHTPKFARWKWLLDVNVMGVVNGIHHVYPRMVRQGHGHIINTASVAGSTGYATAAAYAMSKACVIELTRSLRAEAKAYGVRVSVVCPGYVSSNIFTQDRVLGADLGSVMADLPVKMLQADKAAELLLRGVMRGQNTIVFPFSSRLFWHVSHWAPSLLIPIQKRLIRPFRTSA